MTMKHHCDMESLQHGAPRVMVSEPMWSYRQERILGLEISQDGNGLPFRSVQYPVSRVCRHILVLAFFPITAKMWILRLRSENISSLHPNPPKSMNATLGSE